MKIFRSIALLVFLPLALHSGVFTGEALNTSFTVHGRLRYYNGSGEMRIWIVGSTRMLSVVDGPANKKLNAIFSEDWFNRTIYGDFTVEPTEPDRKGRMRHVKILKVKKVVIERDADRKILAMKKEL